MEPRRGERVFGFFRPYGACSSNAIKPRARARGYSLTPLRGCTIGFIRYPTTTSFFPKSRSARIPRSRHHSIKRFDSTIGRDSSLYLMLMM